MRNKIIIAGGSGFLGQSIINHLAEKKEVEIVVLTRGNTRFIRDIRYITWDAATVGTWAEELEGAAAVINLVGKSVNCRYTAANKKAIIASRVNATRVIAEAINGAFTPPRVWINAGSAAIFGNGGDAVKDELSTTGEGFSAEVCRQWEQAFFGMETTRTKKVLFRGGLVFQRHTGLLTPFSNLVKKGLGGPIGSGDQYISWIHEDDFLDIIDDALTDDTLSGIVHCTSPFPVTNRQFMAALRKAMDVSFGIPAPSFLVKIGAAFLQTEPELVLTGRRVVSRLLKRRKFIFNYPYIDDALANLVGHAGGSLTKL